MKSLFSKWLPLLIVVLLIGGFAYVSVTPVHVDQSPVTKTIPNSRFFQ